MDFPDGASPVQGDAEKLSARVTLFGPDDGSDDTGSVLAESGNNYSSSAENQIPRSRTTLLHLVRLSIYAPCAVNSILDYIC